MASFLPCFLLCLPSLAPSLAIQMNPSQGTLLLVVGMRHASGCVACLSPSLALKLPGLMCMWYACVSVVLAGTCNTAACCLSPGASVEAAGTYERESTEALAAKTVCPHDVPSATLAATLAHAFSQAVAPPFGSTHMLRTGSGFPIT